MLKLQLKCDFSFFKSRRKFYPNWDFGLKIYHLATLNLVGRSFTKIAQIFSVCVNNDAALSHPLKLPGVNVMITNFSDFRQFAAKMAAFIFFNCQIFLRKLKKIITSVPGADFRFLSAARWSSLLTEGIETCEENFSAKRSRRELFDDWVKLPEN
jgi:hypothetical protein